MGIPVLVADDDPISRIVVSGCLEEWGFLPIEAVDGREALQTLLGENPPRIAILDWMMPGISGVDICAELEKRRGAFIYRILLTSRSEKEDHTCALDNGAHLFLSKPVDPEVLHSNLKVGRRLIETEDALLRMERIAAIGTLAGGVAHQYNNMNAGLMGYLDLLLSGFDTTPPQRELLLKMDKICRRMQHITGMLLDSAVGSPGDLSYCQLHELAAVVLEIEKDKLQQEGIVLHLKLEKVPDLALERNGVLQALLHLLVNARQAVYGRENGQITVETGKEGAQVFFRVADNGCGIPLNQQKDIFTPFFSLKGEHAMPESPQREHKGYGLGLSVVENIIHRHGGHIEVQTREGEGSEFTIFLPLSGKILSA